MKKQWLPSLLIHEKVLPIPKKIVAHTGDPLGTFDVEKSQSRKNFVPKNSCFTIGFGNQSEPSHMAKKACSQEKTNYLIDYKIKQQKEIKQKPVVQLVKGKHHQML